MGNIEFTNTVDSRGRWVTAQTVEATLTMKVFQGPYEGDEFYANVWVDYVGENEDATCISQDVIFDVKTGDVDMDSFRVAAEKFFAGGYNKPAKERTTNDFDFDLGD